MNRALAGFLLMLVALCVHAQTGYPGYNQGIQWSTFKSGTTSQLKFGQTRLMVTEGEWQRFWKELTGNEPGTAPKGVDWNTEELAAVAVGERRTGGYSAIIQKVDTDNFQNVTITYCEGVPGPQGPVTQQITSPWVVIRMKRPAGTIKFENGGTVHTPTIPTGPPPYGGSSEGYKPLQWEYLTSGSKSNINQVQTGVLSTPEEFDQYWKSAIGDVDEKIKNSINWKREVIAVVHLGRVPGGTNVGIESVILQTDGQVFVNWYQKAPIVRPADPVNTPYLLFKLPRYTTSPVFRQCAPK